MIEDKYADLHAYLLDSRGRLGHLGWRMNVKTQSGHKQQPAKGDDPKRQRGSLRFSIHGMASSPAIIKDKTTALLHKESAAERIHVTHREILVGPGGDSRKSRKKTPIANREQLRARTLPSQAFSELSAAELAGRLVSEIADSGTDVNALCSAYGLKREELGRLTGFSLRALAEWAAGNIPSQPAKRRLHETRRLLDALAAIVKRESIPAWLHKSNAAFERLTPLQVIELGEIDRLWAMVHDMGSGQPE